MNTHLMRQPVHLRFARAQDEIIAFLVEKGLFRTKSEAVRAAVLLLGEKYRLIKQGLE
jgi:Arc/MetJ-type ribon-helix-helix transcriptional regulator